MLISCLSFDAVRLLGWFDLVCFCGVFDLLVWFEVIGGGFDFALGFVFDLAG